MKKDWDFALEAGKKSYYLMAAQERTGVKFDTEKALELYKYCCEEMDRIEKEVEPQLPEKQLNKGELAEVTPPKNQFRQPKNKKEKEEAGGFGLLPSAASLKWWETVTQTHDGWEATKEGKSYKLPYYAPIRATGPMRLANQAQMKEWLMSLGWKPTLWNFKKDANNKPMRDDKGKLITTSPKFHMQGVLCPNLERMEDKIDLLKPIIRWLSLRNRRSVIWNPEQKSGWLEHPRLKIDGRLPAGMSSLTNTMRLKHRTVVNVPRIGSILGEEMRSLFTVEEGKVMVGYDGSALEARVEAHWCYKHEGGEAYAMELLEGDPHTTNAKAFFGQDIECDEEGKAIPRYRDPAKNGRYALTYGCTEPRLADTLNIPLAKAKEAYNDFWDTNTALKGLRDKLTTHWEAGGKRGIQCPLTGYYLHSRSKHSLVNLLFQHTGAIAMDISALFMDKWLGGLRNDNNYRPYYLYKGYEVRRVLFVH